MIALRLDDRLAARVDASDVVQEALADAARKLADYARSPLAVLSVAAPPGRGAAGGGAPPASAVEGPKRAREEADAFAWPDSSAQLMVNSLVADDTTPAMPCSARNNAGTCTRP